ncbi:hypothetical protein [Natronomonas gomsonensis]|uniref:hypothetical protein n=1 Tax=Natronomonas gomsonensis TaxID=1046043 RepID=UPI0015BAE96F|nr:hypothetical protein [Natronomonas gomsonensis]
MSTNAFGTVAPQDGHRPAASVSCVFMAVVPSWPSRVLGLHIVWFESEPSVNAASNAGPMGVSFRLLVYVCATPPHK